MYGKCIKCGVYGVVEYHHPLPRRWFKFKNNWTEPLCRHHHQAANQLTYDLDADYGVNSEKEGLRMKDAYIEVFITFMNRREHAVVY